MSLTLTEVRMLTFVSLALTKPRQIAIPEYHELGDPGSSIVYKVTPGNDRTIVKVASHPPAWPLVDGSHSLEPSQSCQIAWEMPVNCKATERVMHFFSTLPYGGIPTDEFDFLCLFFDHLYEQWEHVCTDVEDHLSKRVSLYPNYGTDTVNISSMLHY